MVCPACVASVLAAQLPAIAAAVGGAAAVRLAHTSTQKPQAVRQQQQRQQQRTQPQAVPKQKALRS